jgi:hypothetical protein
MIELRAGLISLNIEHAGQSGQRLPLGRWVLTVDAAG